MFGRYQLNFGDIVRGDVCILSDIMELDGTWFVVLKAPKITLEKQQCLFTEIMAQFLKIIHRGCCEQFFTWELFLLLWYSVHELTEDRFKVVTAQDDNF